MPQMTPIGPFFRFFALLCSKIPLTFARISLGLQIKAKLGLKDLFTPRF